MRILLLLLISLTLWANIGNIMAMKGSADIKRNSSLLHATNGMSLLKGDEVITANKSRVQVMLKDSTIITIGANSSFSFEEFVFDGSKASEVSMRANRGFFRSVTGQIGKVAPERFKVKTASATIGIRGTDFSGEIVGDREVFKCYEGAIFIEFEGQINDIDAGMMMEILQNRFEIRELDSQENLHFEDRSGKNLKGLILQSVDGSQIPTEVISDVTQIIEDADNEPNEDVDNTPPNGGGGSFNLDASTEDRVLNY